jgi:uracil-DNA glycosylase family 4
MNSSKKENRSRLFLKEMGLTPVWTLRGLPAGPEAAGEAFVADAIVAKTEAAEAFSAAADRAPAAASSDSDIYAPERIAQLDWPSLKETVSGCVKCGLCQGRTKTVFGTGDEKATWLFIGEGPGRNEDQQGEPFIGQAGRLLDNMLLALGLRRGDNAYIANVVKCRPTDREGRDRPPTSEEAAACLPYLQRQIELIKPTVLVALGKTAAISLLGLDPNTSVGTLRGKVHRYGDLPLVVTYHPAYLLRKLTEKGKVWNDLCLAIEAHAGEVRASA